MKKFIIIMSFIAMIGASSFNEGAFAADCPPDCTKLNITYEHGTGDQHTVHVAYRDCGGNWAIHGVWGSGMGPYTYCVKSGADEIVIRKLDTLFSDPLLKIPPAEQLKGSAIYMYCKPGGKGERLVVCRTFK